MIWSSPVMMPVLEDNDIHIWRIDLTSSCVDFIYLESLLSSEEMIRARKYQGRHLYERFVKTRAKLRLILARYLEVSPSELIFQYTPNGKPFLNFEINFNLSHSQDLAVIAASKQIAVGVDLEYKREIDDLAGICCRFLSLKDCDEIFSLTPTEQIHAFYDIWVKREAYTKVLGGRLFDVLTEFREKNKSLQDQKIATIQSFYTHEKYASALAIIGKSPLIKFWQGSGAHFASCLAQ